MSDYRELLIGCGSRRVKDLRLPTAEEIKAPSRDWYARIRNGVDFKGLFTLDNNEDHNPDLLVDLADIMNISTRPRFFDMRPHAIRPWEPNDSSFDEIHAYEVLEHIGAQGDYLTFFAQFAEFHRILKPGGLFFATCPSWCSLWAWGDPSHTRVITSGTLAFLSQAEYVKQVGKTPMSDFRNVYRADFRCLYVHEDSEYLGFVLECVK